MGVLSKFIFGLDLLYDLHNPSQALGNHGAYPQSTLERP